jgi:hypothetical protein
MMEVTEVTEGKGLADIGLKSRWAVREYERRVG